MLYDLLIKIPMLFMIRTKTYYLILYLKQIIKILDYIFVWYINSGKFFCNRIKSKTGEFVLNKQQHKY